MQQLYRANVHSITVLMMIKIVENSIVYALLYKLNRFESNDTIIPSLIM
jgi:hypothetical protein